jgi:histidinol-phosphate aminotransferase
MNIRPAVRALPPYHFKARPYRIKLDQNESAYDLPAELKARVLERIAALPFNRYPDLTGESLRAALGRYHGWDEAAIALSGGSNVLIQALAEACGLGRTVLTVTPTFSIYAMQARILGTNLVEAPLEPDFSLPKRALLEVLEQNQGVFFLANPAAPTGNVFAEEEVLELIEAAAPDDWTVVLDEAYGQFARSDLSHLAREHPHVVSLRTFSKAFGLAGVRLGYALTSTELATELRKVTLPFSVSSLQLAVGLTVLEAPEYLEPRLREVEHERERVFAALASLPGLTVYPSRTNFLLFRVADAEGFFQNLLTRDVLVRRQDHLPGLTGCLRVTIGTPVENDAFLAAAGAACTELEAQVHA